MVIIWHADQRLGPLSAKETTWWVLEIQTQQQGLLITIVNLLQTIALFSAFAVFLIELASSHIWVHNQDVCDNLPKSWQVKFLNVVTVHKVIFALRVCRLE